LCFLSGSLYSQGVIGVVRENISNQPIENAEVSLLKGDSLIAITSTDSQGQYQFIYGDAGRMIITVSASGFKTVISDDVFLDGYSTIREDVLLYPGSIELNEVTVLSPIVRSLPSVYHITKDDLNTVAGNFDDPVRVATSRPGIILINDQANHISVRGQNPIFNTWYLEGLEIVNPNHTNNAGTFSDRPTQSGGGVNMFSAQILGSTDVYTGLNPLSLGRSAGAVIDMHLLESVKPEFRAKAGFLGFELGGGKKIGTNGVLDINLRYSFTGLLADLGVDFSGEKIGFYDGVISYRNQGQKDVFKLFAWGGRSTNQFERVEKPEDRERYKDFFSIDYGNDILGAGIKYEYSINSKVSLHSGAAYSLNHPTYEINGQFQEPVSSNENWGNNKIFYTQAGISMRHSANFQTEAGINFIHHALTNPGRYLPFRKEVVLRPYVTSEIVLSPKFSLEVGGELNHSFDPKGWTPGYRALVKWNSTGSIYAYGGIRHAAGQMVMQSHVLLDSGPLIIDKYEAGLRFSKKHTFDLNIYYQEIKKLPVYPRENGFYHTADLSDALAGDLGNNVLGDGKYYGAEASWEYSSAKGWKLSANQSLFRSLRRFDGNLFEAGRYDGKFATHVALAKEIIKQKKGKNRIWNLSLRGIFNGGLWEQDIDVVNSDITESTVYLNPGLFNKQLPTYKRIDAGISRTIANNKIRWRYALDIQNLFGFTNIAYHYYDPFLQQVISQEHLGIIPVFSVQASW
jgi:hypothetical protein